MRYILAWLHAADKDWPGFKEKVPPGAVWASCSKTEGYLRSDTSSFILDEFSGIRVTEDRNCNEESLEEDSAEEE